MYKFPLESVLKFRGNMEKFHLQDMFRLKSDLKSEEGRLLEEKKRAVDVAGQLAEEEKNGISPVEAALFKKFLHTKRVKIVEQKEKILSLKNEVEKKRQELENASREKKVMEKLKDKGKEGFHQDMRKKHQKEMDEYAVKSFTRDKNTNVK